MAIFNLNFKTLWEQLTPPLLRKPGNNKWGEALMEPMNYNNQLFNDYMSGSSYSIFYSATTYSATNRVIYVDNSVYENLTGSTSILPTDVNNWIKINDSYIGANERSKYRAQKYLFEYAFNMNYQVSGTTRTSQYGSGYTNIYIETLPAVPNSFVMGQTGQYSSAMFNLSTNSLNFMTNNYTAFSSDYIIWVPNYIYTATTYGNLKAFAEKYNLVGMTYQILNY